uniref:Complex 1 LYR protein domain-containing protein n=1 Tax=Monodon monoceros TaxID=40151 RepID=A0A8C6CCN5_MONMO
IAASSHARVLDMYQAMLRESKHFSADNDRTYTIRRIRDVFRENKNVKDPVNIQALIINDKGWLSLLGSSVRMKSWSSSKDCCVLLCLLHPTPLL